MKPFLTALLVVASLLFSSVSSRAQIPILAGAYRDNPLRLTYTFVGLYQKPVITAVAKKDANGLPLAANLQPKVTTTPDPVVPGVYAVVVGYDTTSSLPINSWLEIKLNGQVFAAGPVTIDRTNRSGSYAVFVNTVTLITTSGLNSGNGNSGGGIDLTQVTNLLKDKVDKVTGKDLSTNDFTDVYRNKLDTLRGGAGATITPVFAAVRSVTLTAGATPTASITGPITAMTLTVGIPPGKDGLPGIPGNPGTNGVTPVFASVVSSTLAAGSTPTVSVTGPASSLTLAIGIPAGPAGTPGAAGPSNSLTVGTVTTGAPGSAVTFTITGTPPNQVVNVSIPQGFSGTPGTNGVSPNLTIGSIVTGSPGSSASATISGTFPNLVLNLTIPQGTAGTGGSTPIANNLTTTATGSALDATQGKVLKDLSDTKVDKVTGKVLSTNDYTSADQAKVAATSGTNTGDETAAGIKSKLGITTLSGSNTGDQIITNNLTTTAPGTALDAVQGKTISDSLTAQRSRIATNALAVAGKFTTTDTVKLVQKVTGSRLLTPAEQTKLANTSGTNSGDETAAGIRSKLGITTLSGVNTGDQVPTNNLTTTTTGTGLDAVQGKRLADSLAVQRTDINANKTLANSKQNAINSATDLIANSITLGTPVDSDSTRKGATTDWVRRYVLRVMPSFIDFPYDTTYFSFSSQFAPKAGAFRRLFTPGVGITINYATGEITSTATGSGSTNVVTGTDPNNTGSTATFLLPPANGGRVFIGNASLQPYALNLRYVSGVEAMPGFKSNAGNLGFGLDADATVWRINNVVSFNSSSNGTGTDNGYKFYGSSSRYMQINEANGDKAPVLVRITTAGQVGIGTETPTANLDVVGTAKVSGAAQIGGQLTATGGIKFGDGTTLTTAPTGGGSSPILYITDPASFASSAAGYNYIQYDGSVWIRSSGNVDSNTDNNAKYTALQYNAGSDHFDRQYSGYAMFSWWRNSSGNRWQQLKYAINHTVGAKIQVEDGTYDFTENAFSPGNFEVRGNLVDPSRVVFRAVSSQTMIFNGWFWYDGVTDGQRFDNILIHGIRFVQASTATTNTSRGPIVFEGASQNNITIRKCEYLQQSTTAITNFFFTKSGANLKTQNITFEENRSVNPTTKGRMMYEAINQDHPNNDKGVGTNIKIRKNYISGFNYGFSVAGNFDNTLVDDNDIGNCDNYGNEFAGSNTNATLSNNRFFGTHNVLWASNYHGETGGSDGDYPITTGSGQHYINNHTVGKISGGYVEIRGGGIVEFVGNDLRMDGGILFLQTSLGGVTGGIMQRNQIISSMTNTNWRNQTTNLIFFNGANNVKVSSNYFERGGTDASAVVQVNSNGLTNTGNLFFQNILQTGANGTYFGAASTSTIRVGNINPAGTAVN